MKLGHLFNTVNFLDNMGVIILAKLNGDKHTHALRPGQQGKGVRTLMEENLRKLGVCLSIRLFLFPLSQASVPFQ